jgi:hypothetical protein
VNSYPETHPATIIGGQNGALHLVTTLGLRIGVLVGKGVIAVLGRAFGTSRR